MKVLGAALLFAIAATSIAAEFTLKPGEDALAVRDRIRAARTAGRIARDEPVTVTFAPGDYLFPKALLLEKVDSGTEKGPVVWRAEKPGTARILGGNAIPRTAFGALSDEVRGRLDSAVADKVLEADLKPILVREPKPWPDSPVRGQMPGPWLYVGGRSQQLARWPNTDAPDGGWYGFSNVLQHCGYEADKRAGKPAVIEFPGDRAERWRFDEGVWLMGYFVVDWDCDLQRVASYDRATHGARFAAITHYGVGKGGWPFYRRRFCAVNLLEELDAPGEWYYDRKRTKLYWYPGADEGEIVLALDLTPFVRMDGTRHVRFENLSFAYSHGAAPAVVLHEARQCAVKDCSFDCIAYLAVDVQGGVRNTVTGCRMTNFGSKVVRLSGGDRKALLPANNLVEGCEIANYGMYQRAHSKAFDVEGCGNAIRGCRVSRAPEGAVSYSGNEHLFADNDFGNIVLEVGDAGAIYSGHNASYLGSVLFGNCIHHLAKTEAEENSRSAIYFDDCDWGDDAIGNTLVHCGKGFLVGGGKLHGLYNNLVADCRMGISLDGRGRDWRIGRRGSFWWAKTGRTFAEYRHDESGIDPDRAPWCVAYPALREAMDNRPEYPGMNEFSRNVFANCRIPLRVDGYSKRVADASLPGNTVLTNVAAENLRAPQPIRLKDAVRNRLVSADGATVAEFALDESGHFHWTLDVGEKPILDRSPLGITVGYFDCGRKVVPGPAVFVGEMSLAGFTNATVQVELKDGVAVRSRSTNVVSFVAQTAKEWRIPIRSLITAEEIAFLDVRVWNGGAAYRWTVPGEGVRRIYGENDAFMPANGDRGSLTPLEWERDDDFGNGYPESLYYVRGPGYGVMFPEFEHGVNHAGSVVSPWRGITQ